MSRQQVANLKRVAHKKSLEHNAEVSWRDVLREAGDWAIEFDGVKPQVNLTIDNENSK
jgi:hypothetical protein